MQALDRALLWVAERQLVPALFWSIGLCEVCAHQEVREGLKVLAAWALGGAVMWWRGNVLVREAGRR